MEILCCFGGLGYFSAKIKEMGQLTQGRGKWSNSHFLIFARVASIQLTAAGPTAAGYNPQFRVRPGPEVGSTTPTFPFPQEVNWHNLGQWAPFPLLLWCCWAVHCPLLRGAEGLLDTGCAPDTPLCRGGGAVGRGMGETRPALPWDKSQG